MKFFKKLLFIIKHKISNKTKIGFNIYVKNIENISIGKNSKILSNCSLEADKGKIIIGDNITLNRYTYCKGSKGLISIGNGTEINNFTRIDGWGEVIIGENVLIGPSVNIISYQHNYKDKNNTIKSQGSTTNKIIIEDDVWIGANSNIMAGIHIKKALL